MITFGDRDHKLKGYSFTDIMYIVAPPPTCKNKDKLTITRI